MPASHCHRLAFPTQTRAALDRLAEMAGSTFRFRTMRQVIGRAHLGRDRSAAPTARSTSLGLHRAIVAMSFSVAGLTASTVVFSIGVKPIHPRYTSASDIQA
jgi:hypothetical protein